MHCASKTLWTFFKISLERQWKLSTEGYGWRAAWGQRMLMVHLQEGQQWGFGFMQHARPLQLFAKSSSCQALKPASGGWVQDYAFSPPLCPLLLGQKHTLNVSQRVATHRQSLSQTDLGAPSERLDASRESRRLGNRSLGNANRVPMATGQGRKKAQESGERG